MNKIRSSLFLHIIGSYCPGPGIVILSSRECRFALDKQYFTEAVPGFGFTQL